MLRNFSSPYLLLSNRKEREFWTRDWFQITKSRSYSILHLQLNLNVRFVLQWSPSISMAQEEEEQKKKKTRELAINKYFRQYPKKIKKIAARQPVTVRVYCNIFYRSLPETHFNVPVDSLVTYLVFFRSFVRFVLVQKRNNKSTESITLSSDISLTSVAKATTNEFLFSS